MYVSLLSLSWWAYIHVCHYLCVIHALCYHVVPVVSFLKSPCVFVCEDRRYPRSSSSVSWLQRQRQPDISSCWVWLQAAREGKKWIMYRKRETKWKQNKTEGSKGNKKAVWEWVLEKEEWVPSTRVKRKCKKRGREVQQKSIRSCITVRFMQIFLQLCKQKKSGFYHWDLWFNYIIPGGKTSDQESVAETAKPAHAMIHNCSKTI